MRIAIRLWLSLLATFVLVLGVGVAVRVGEEQELLLETTLRDRRFFAHAIQAALSRDHGTTDPLREAEAMLGSEEVAGAHIVARLVAPRVEGMSRPRLPNVETQLVAGDVVVGVHEDEIVTYIPIERGHQVIAIELSEPQAVTALLRRIGWWALALQTLALAMLAGIVTYVLTRWFVGKPIERLRNLARRIAGGDLTARETIAGDGEVAELADEMNDMARQLEEARKALDELDVERSQALEQLRHADRLRTVGQLASQLAHELGTPLNVITGHARIVEEDPAASSDVQSSARTVLEQAHRMAKIVRGLLDFTRRRAERRVVDVAELAESARLTLAPLARKARVQVVVERQGTMGRVDANPQELLQVFTNLLVNAFQAMEQGGLVRVIIQERDATPPAGTDTQPGRFVVVSVHDQGHGIAEEDMPKLFEAFFTRKKEGEGTGLGLAVVDGIVRDHKGWITVERAEGRGSIFHVFLPRH
jgi:signal transduction histidine kinase